ncbi:hypothetical protein [Paludibacterium purpuratum]|uniref:Uncharacterized protein n=1 Tax=Paludibacterium purpuratum TaxID=1144873 RepID=A0A4R7BAG3_9NEIS|nr:hypothetical protein [Paludibacterium purpuratum]TDR81583.1 hypothetical protein DFP86_103240 [Paludibacterium purpuratum]
MSDIRAIKLVRNLSNQEIDVINYEHPNKPGNHVVVPAGEVMACNMWTPWCDSQHALDGLNNSTEGTRDDVTHYIQMTPHGNSPKQIFQHGSAVFYTTSVRYDLKVKVNGDAELGKGDYELIIRANTDLTPEYKKI